ncbi:MAG TPA: hypothetical protein VEL28_09305, partial [Candidatus Binatia bacterium]|nr:hypothetical protein [Candidatus Binatia bacterium]
MKAQQILARGRRAESVVCLGCEERCLVLVHSAEQPSRSEPFVVCDKRSDVSRVAVSAAALRRWRANDESLCQFVADVLGLRRTATSGDTPNPASCRHLKSGQLVAGMVCRFRLAPDQSHVTQSGRR